MSSAFEIWISSQECFEVLRSCAKQVSKRADRLGIILKDAHIETESRNEYLSSVASDLWQFLKGNAPQIARQATVLLLSGDDAAFMAFVCQKFLDDCIEERRSSSPFHNYYRRMRSLLSEAAGIHYEAQSRKGSYYAYSTRTDLDKLPAGLAGMDYGEWNACETSLRDIYEKPAMLDLSRHYWDESLREFLQEYLLPIRELVRFIFKKYPLMLTVEYSDAQGAGDDGEESVISLENRYVDSNAVQAFDAAWKRQLPVIEADIIDNQLETLARDCTAELTEQERIVLSRLDEGEKLESVAEFLGMKGASNISYHQKKAYSKIHTKWSLWGPPSLKKFTDVDEEEFFMFYEKVIECCKQI